MNFMKEIKGERSGLFLTGKERLLIKEMVIWAGSDKSESVSSAKRSERRDF